MPLSTLLFNNVNVKVFNLAVVVWQIDELYSEVLYEVIHTVGCMAEAGEQDVLFLYLQKAFRLDSEKHENLLQQAQSKEVPTLTNSLYMFRFPSTHIHKPLV